MNANDTIHKLAAAINSHDPGAWTACYGANAVVLDPQYPEPLRGTDAIRKDYADFLTAFPDLTGTVKQTIVNGENYAAEVSMAGTHKGPLTGPTGSIIPATNKRVELRGVMIGRLDGSGRIVEERRYYDLAGVLGQLGLLQ